MTRKLGRTPSFEDLSEHLSITAEEYHEYLLLDCAKTLESLDDLLGEDALNGTLNSRSLEDEMVTSGTLRAALASLDEREQLILTLYYQQEMSLKEIALVLDLTEARVCQLNKRSLRRSSVFSRSERYMQKFLGIFIIFACVVGGFLMSGGRLASFWQPGEIIIILGAGMGAMVLANPKPVLAEMYRQFRGIMRKNEYTDEYQRQLLMLLYELLELVQDGGLKVLDEHIEVPESSPLFQKYPLILQNKAIITFIADNFRLMAMGKINEHELEGS